MIVLPGTVLGHSAHDFRRHIPHAFEDHVRDMPVASRAFLFSELLEPCLEGEPFGRRLRFQRRCLLIWKLDHRH